MQSIWYTRNKCAGYTLFELLCAIALFSILALALLQLQQSVLFTALEVVQDNAPEQYLLAVQQRMRLILVDAVEVTVQKNPHSLRVLRQLSDGLCEFVYSIAPTGSAFHEHVDWVIWRGSGARPKPYTTPIASEITGFSATLQKAPRGTLVHIDLSSYDLQRSITVLARNTASVSESE